MIDIRVSDPRTSPERELVIAHLAGMHDSSPPESVHALGIDALAGPGLTLWSAWDGAELAGIGALKVFEEDRGELKSMRVADAFLGRGIGRLMLRHIVADAQSRGLASLWLETGSTPEFVPAAALYRSEGFVPCAPFADYTDDPFSLYFTRAL
ncbi:GNAT family N-acetyltransferase [Microbacterium sp. cx-59]|uniref:GNAT family N-acetyltransferase n=1 Tax=Microbacterium sp. cx-59 TaxID=2891207 RepID=UPI001E35E551|nr:GNAT family N-acetyltransferase [Microbacterium sp. cx-59]MCC4908852.1 GNAT family N-acetyltransferase [Microbacterium sp. cx-59]